MDFPEPLFEGALHRRAVCLACGRRPARSVLRTPGREVVPLCADCAADWNLYGYQLLKRVRPGPLVRRLLRFKLGHPFRGPSWPALVRDLRGFSDWAKRMRRWM
ncbi:MAG: hypothetical protein ACJ8F7_23485 [Gemmataceae bacterium]